MEVASDRLEEWVASCTGPSSEWARCCERGKRGREMQRRLSLFHDEGFTRNRDGLGPSSGVMALPKSSSQPVSKEAS